MSSDVAEHPYFRVTWEQYEQFVRCPQWYNWEHLSPKEIGTSQKDTQHLMRGNASQWLLDKWARTRLWENGSPGRDSDFVRAEARRAVIEGWVEDQHKGRPKASTYDIEKEVSENLTKTIQAIRAHWEELGIRPAVIIPQWDVESESYQDKIRCQARIDLLLITTEGTGIIYEGKATRKPEKTNDEQVRWQAQIVMGLTDEVHESVIIEGDEPRTQQKHVIDYGTVTQRQRHTFRLATQHFLVFFHSAEIRPVTVKQAGAFQTLLTLAQRDWLGIRDIRLRKMRDGELKAIPSSYNCRICPFLQLCPDRYQPKKRITETAAPPPVAGHQINIM